MSRFWNVSAASCCSCAEAVCWILVSVTVLTEANQNFSRVTRIAEKKGQAVIFKNNRPKYMLIDLENSPMIEMTEDEKIDFVAARILKKYKAAFLELAK